MASYGIYGIGFHQKPTLAIDTSLFVGDVPTENCFIASCQKVYSVAPTHAAVRRDHQTHWGRSVSNFIPCLQINLENPGSLGLVGFTTFVSEMVYHCNRFIVTGLTAKRGRRWQRTFRLAKDWNPKSTMLSGAKMFTKVYNSRHSHAQSTQLGVSLLQPSAPQGRLRVFYVWRGWSSASSVSCAVHFRILVWRSKSWLSKSPNLGSTPQHSKAGAPKQGAPHSPVFLACSGRGRWWAMILWYWIYCQQLVSTMFRPCFNMFQPCFNHVSVCVFLYNLYVKTCIRRERTTLRFSARAHQALEPLEPRLPRDSSVKLCPKTTSMPVWDMPWHSAIDDEYGLVAVNSPC